MKINYICISKEKMINKLKLLICQNIYKIDQVIVKINFPIFFHGKKWEQYFVINVYMIKIKLNQEDQVSIQHIQRII